MSTQPGATMAPSAAISRRPRSSTRPTATMVCPSMARSARNADRPVPSTTTPSRITRSCMVHAPQGGSNRMHSRHRGSRMPIAFDQQRLGRVDQDRENCIVTYVYLSYDRRDIDHLGRLATQFRRRGVTFRYDPEPATPERFDSLARHMIDACAAIVVIDPATERRPPG